MRILIIEDELHMLELLSQGLYENGFTVMTASDGETGLAMATMHELDALVLDIGLPKMDGYALMRALRAQACAVPVLMLTARDTEDDIIHGLDAGADDYLIKPFSFPELVARLQSITRCCRENADTMKAGDLALDPARGMVTQGSRDIDLTRLEFLLLSSLLRHPGQCVPRQTLIESVWGADHAVGPSALEVLINGLRTKIDVPFRKTSIGTIRGLGYIFKLSATGGNSC
jgi:DNA-binding response OmpR family regulator